MELPSYYWGSRKSYKQHYLSNLDDIRCNMGKGGEIIISFMGTEVGCAGRRKAKEQRWKGGKRKREI